MLMLLFLTSVISGTVHSQPSNCLDAGGLYHNETQAGSLYHDETQAGGLYHNETQAGGLYHNETQACYTELTQGPCLDHQWLVRENNGTDVGECVSKSCPGEIAVMNDDGNTVMCISAEKMLAPIRAQNCGKRRIWIDGHCRRLFNAIVLNLWNQRTVAGEDSAPSVGHIQHTKCTDATHLYHNETKTCFTHQTQGPCRDNQWLVKQINNDDFGVCVSKPCRGNIPVLDDKGSTLCVPFQEPLAPLKAPSVSCGEHKIWIDGECRPLLSAIIRNLWNNWTQGKATK